MKKAELSSRVASEASLTSADAYRIVNAVFTDMGEALANGDTVRISRSGTFSTSALAVSQGRNLRTGESIAIYASKAPPFKTGKAVRDAVN